MGGANTFLSSPAPLAWGLRWPLLPASPDPPASLLCPQDQCNLEGPWRVGDQPGSSAGSPCPSGWGSHPPLLSCSSLRAPLACLSCSPLSLPPMPPGPRRPGWGFGWGEPAWELSRLPSPSGPGHHPLLLSHSSWRGPPTCLS